MSRCSVEPVEWKNRPAWRLANDKLALTIVLGGGHFVDLRLHGSPINALWEAPWRTIDPGTFCSDHHAALYGEGAVGKFLSGYSGHAVAIPYFGMPTETEAAQGLALHGEAASTPWSVTSSRADDRSAQVTFEVDLPISRLRLRRDLTLHAGANVVRISETVSNHSSESRDIQWVQHAAFGEPLLAEGESSLSISATRGITWPLGYEGHELLPNNSEFVWPGISTPQGEVELSAPFIREGTGFVAALQLDPLPGYAFIAAHNRRLALAAGYVFNCSQFPWIALWEENCARSYPPWDDKTKARGVEFGTSPMPLGLENAREMRSLFGTPTFATLAGCAKLQTDYKVFLTPVPPAWKTIPHIERTPNALTLTSNAGDSHTLLY